MRKLRLLLTDKCNRNCVGCCNKDWNLASLPVCTDFDSWNMAMLTGGEPMLNPQLVIDVAYKFPLKTIVVVYTAKVDDITKTVEVLTHVDGMTVTLHEQSDIEPFLLFNERIFGRKWVEQLSLRLNIFRGVQLPSGVDLRLWKVKDDIAWIKDCPLPEDEVFMRYQV